MKQKSLRQLAKEIGVSASYLSQVKNGKRPASDKLLRSIGLNRSVKQNVGQSVKQSRHPVVAPDKRNSYNINLLGISLAVGRLTLDQLGQVRILDPQPVWRIRLEA